MNIPLKEASGKLDESQQQIQRPNSNASLSNASKSSSSSSISPEVQQIIQEIAEEIRNENNPPPSDENSSPKPKKLSDIGFESVYVTRRIKNLNIQRILIAERRHEIAYEKTKLRDLKLKDTLGKHVLEMEREISEKVLESQKLSIERRNCEIELDGIKKQDESVGRCNY